MKTVKKEKNGCIGLLYIIEVYALQFMTILIQFSLQIKTPQIKQEKKQRETRKKFRQQVCILIAFLKVYSYLTI